MLVPRIVSLLLGVVLIISTTSISPSYVYKGSPNCPFAWQDQPRHTWKDFFMGKYGDTPWIMFTVKFDHLTHNIGTIPAGSSFTMARQGGVWTASGKNVFGDNKSVGYANGDPEKYELSVWGALLKYNEAGQVYLDKELVGSLRCGIGPDA
jgi:hypothetical protein